MREHHFQTSIYPMTVSLFHGSTWSNSYVKDTVFVLQHLLQTLIITSGLWMIREKLKNMLLYSTQELLFLGSYFFKIAAFLSFFRTVTLSQVLFLQSSFFFGAKLLQSRHFLRIWSSLRQLLFGMAIFSGGTVYDKDILKSYFFKAGTSAQS